MDGGGCRGSAADRFPPHAHRRARTLPPADPGEGARALCRRAGRRRVRDRSLSRRGRRRPGGDRGRGIAGADRRRCARRARSTPRHSTAVASVRKFFGDVDKAFAAAHAVVDARSGGRPPQRRAVGNARRHRPARRGARRARNVRRRQGAALESRHARPHARPRAVGHPSLRRPCRRRLRHPRRTLSGGRARVRRRAAPQTPGEMDRGPARASHRGEPFAPAALSRPRRGR